MKNRFLIFMMVVVAAIGMISCGNSNPAAPDASVTGSISATDNIETSTENVDSLAETAGDFKLKLENVNDYIVSLAPYVGREVAVHKEPVDDETVTYYAQYTFSNQAYNIEGWVADNGDTVIMDYVGKMDGVAFEGGTASGASLELGSNTYIPGFEEGLIGVKEGDELDLNLSFPDPYYNNPDYSGKECVFTVTVTRVVPGLSDEAVTALNNPSFANVAEYKAYIKGILDEQANQQYEQDVVQAVVDLLVEESTFKELPEEFLAYEGLTLVENFSSDASYYGMTVEEYLEACGSSLLEQETVYAKEQLVFYKIATELGVSVTEEDIDAKINEYIDLYSDINSAEDVYNYIASRDLMYEAIIITNVFDYLMENTTVVEPTE